MTQPLRLRPEILTDMASSVSHVCLVGKFKLSLWEYHSVRGYFDTLLGQSTKGTAIWDTEVSVCLDIECPPKDSSVWSLLYSRWTHWAAAVFCTTWTPEPWLGAAREWRNDGYTYTEKLGSGGLISLMRKLKQLEAQHIHYLNRKEGLLHIAEQGGRGGTAHR